MLRKTILTGILGLSVVLVVAPGSLFASQWSISPPTVRNSPSDFPSFRQTGAHSVPANDSRAFQLKERPLFLQNHNRIGSHVQPTPGIQPKALPVFPHDRYQTLPHIPRTNCPYCGDDHGGGPCVMQHFYPTLRFYRTSDRSPNSFSASKGGDTKTGNGRKVLAVGVGGAAGAAGALGALFGRKKKANGG